MAQLKVFLGLSCSPLVGDCILELVQAQLWAMVVSLGTLQWCWWLQMNPTSINTLTFPILSVLLISGKALESHTSAVEVLKIKNLTEIRVNTSLSLISVCQSTNWFTSVLWSNSWAACEQLCEFEASAWFTKGIPRTARILKQKSCLRQNKTTTKSEKSCLNPVPPARQKISWISRQR